MRDWKIKVHGEVNRIKFVLNILVIVYYISVKIDLLLFCLGVHQSGY